MHNLFLFPYEDRTHLPYVNASFTSGQKRQVQLGVNRNLDVSVYARPELTEEQMNIIRIGLEQGLNMRPYVSKSITVPEYALIISGLKNGYSFEPYLGRGFNELQLDIITAGLVEGFNVDLFAKPEYSGAKMECIYECLESEEDISFLDLDKFSAEQLKQIAKGCKSCVSIEVYANPELSVNQMQIIRWCLEDGVEASAITFAKPEYDEDQMSVLCDVLYDGIDISDLVKPELTAFGMNLIYLDKLKVNKMKLV